MESVLAIGPAASGKSTFCLAVKEFLQNLNVKSCILNLDPANEFLPYNADIDICDLITLEDVCMSTDLGPNGGLFYCMEFILKNISWLKSQLFEHRNEFILIDCPGQIELFTQNLVLVNILKELQKSCDLNCVVVNLIDSNMCAQPHNFIAACLASLSSMTHLELPHINVLTKIDLLNNYYSDLRFNLEFYTDVFDLSRLVSSSDLAFNKKLANISKKLAEVIDDFGLVTFRLFSVNDKETMYSLVKYIEKSLGTQTID